MNKRSSDYSPYAVFCRAFEARLQKLAAGGWREHPGLKLRKLTDSALKQQAKRKTPDTFPTTPGRNKPPGFKPTKAPGADQA